MKPHAMHVPGPSKRTRPAAGTKPERVEAVGAQEQFSGPVPLRSERPLAEIMHERQAGTDPSSPSPVFIP
jgi:hypothetical protein